MTRNLLFGRGRRGGGASRQTVVAGLAVGALGAFMFLSFGALFIELDTLGMGTARAGMALALVFVAAVSGLLVFDLHYAVSSLLFDSDLALLVRAPLSPGQILLLKLVDSLPRTTAMIFVLALPAVMAFSWSHPLPPWGWLLLPLQLAGLWAVPLGLGLCGALLLLRMAPARRARDVLTLLSTLVVVALWAVNAFVLPQALGGDESVANRLMRILEPHSWTITVSPPHWAGSALAAAADGDLPRALGWTALLILVGLLSLGVASVVTRALLDEAMARVAVDPAGLRHGARPRSRARFAPGWRALLLKDARLFMRDWTVLGDVITGALLWTLLPLVVRPLHAFSSELVVRVMVITLTIGLGFEVGTRAVPFERDGLAWCLLAPVRPWRWSLAKLASGLVISLPFLAAAALVGGVALGIDARRIAESWVVGASSLVLALGVGLWTGWAFGDLRWTNPRAMLTLPGRILSGLLLGLLAGMWLVVLAIGEIARDHLPPGAFLWGPPLVAVLLTAPMVALAVRRMKRFEWKG
jgi:hypothetical protein